MESTPGYKPSLAIAVLTFRRQEPLAALIPLLLEQAASVAADAAAYVLVVDNDPDRSAESLVGQFADQGVVYANEPEPGIATARNRALKSASTTDLLVFIDDDEVPVENWLKNLLVTYREFNSVGVVGNVLRKYEVTPGFWPGAISIGTPSKPVHGSTPPVPETSCWTSTKFAPRMFGLIQFLASAAVRTPCSLANWFAAGAN